MSGRMWLALPSLILAAVGVVVLIVAGLNVVRHGIDRSMGLLIVSLLAGAVAAIGAIVAGCAVRFGLGASEEGDFASVLAKVGIRVGVLLAVLTLLATLLAPNFFEASRPSPVARAKSEIRQIAVALETYYIDHNSYPPAADAFGNLLPYHPVGEAVSAGYVPCVLTTPIAYLEEIPMDLFHLRPDGSEGSYRYATNGLSCWIMTSRGPDRDDDVPIEEYPVVEKGNCEWRRFMSPFGGPAVEYDGTNGSTSSGDIVRTGP